MSCDFELRKTFEINFCYITFEYKFSTQSALMQLIDSDFCASFREQ